VLRLSGTQLAARIRRGELKSRDVVQAHIDQVQRVNPQLNAMVAQRFEAALAEAEAADAEPSDAPFHGVPCSIKECFALEGMPWTSGLVRRKGTRAHFDATAVARYRAAGAIPLGVTNTSELCMWMESDNFVYGRSRNPYDLDRIVGGSSGGEGALIGAGGAPFGLGSDIGGSIRMPAFFNGVFGHKPSGGLVPGTGQYPMAEGEARRMLATGPLCRRAEDLMPLLRVLAGPDGQDDTLDVQLGDPAQVQLKGLRVLMVRDNGSPPSRELARAQERAAQHLAGRGARIEQRSFPLLRRSFDIWSSALGHYNETPFGVLMGQGEAISPLRELALRALGKSQHTTMASMLALTEALVEHVPGYRERMLGLGEELQVQILEALGGQGVMLYPSFPMTAPKHKLPVLRQLTLRFDYAYTAILNYLRLPVTQVPLGLDRRGLPLGVQVVAAPLQDHRAIAVALELEHAFGGWSPPVRWL
jgi:fatty acid amide hydrolase 2